MLLRRITKHVKDQNWTAVALDFVIVVVGVFIGIQVANWNEDRKSRDLEQAILLQLKTEFTDIREDLVRQISVREQWAESLHVLVEAIEGLEPAAEDDIKLGLAFATNAGRQVARSATFIQLMSSGKLSDLSQEHLRTALLQYDARLERDAFIHETLLELVSKEFSENGFVDRNTLTETRAGARIDQNSENIQEEAIASIRGYDLEGIAQYETLYEAIYRMHILQLTAEETQLALLDDVLRQLPGAAAQ